MEGSESAQVKISGNVETIVSELQAKLVEQQNRIAELEASLAQKDAQIAQLELAATAGEIRSNIFEFQSIHDPLTHELNKEGFLRVAGLKLAAFREDQAKNEQQLDAAKRVCAIVYGDLTGFKQVNERLGHLEADKVLGKVGQQIRGVLRIDDELGRVGGDEYAVFIYNVTPNTVPEIVERIEQAATDEKEGVSGIFDYHVISPQESIEEAMTKADKASEEKKKRYYQERGLKRRK